MSQEPWTERTFANAYHGRRVRLHGTEGFVSGALYEWLDDKSTIIAVVFDGYCKERPDLWVTYEIPPGDLASFLADVTVL